MISGHGRTELVAVCLDSPGKTLYRAIKKRSGLFVSLMHGVNIIRHSVSLCDQGIRHLSTVFVLPVMGEGGGRTRLGIHIQIYTHVNYCGHTINNILIAIIIMIPPCSMQWTAQGYIAYLCSIPVIVCSSMLRGCNVCGCPARQSLGRPVCAWNCKGRG